MGSIEVICGGMFAGKSEELIRRLRRARIAKRRVQVFKPSKDKRYSNNKVVDHNGSDVACVPVNLAYDIWAATEPSTDVVGVDEAQFFDSQIVDIVTKLANRGARVIVAGLDQDWMGQPFGSMPQLLAIADDVTKLHAVCVSCGSEATKSFRKATETDTVRVGGHEAYEALCRDCYLAASRQSNHNPT